MRQINRLLLFYLLALCILLSSVITNLVITDRLAERLEKDTALVNLSGRQRMLSQRIIYLAQDLVLSAETPPETRAALERTVSEFEAGIELFARSHDRLSGASDIEPAVEELYFSSSDGPSLDSRVRDYIRLARQVAATPSDTASLAALKEIERTGLLADLDAVVSEIESISVGKVELMQTVEYWSLVIAVLIVLLEIGFVFLPGHRLISNTMSDLEARNAELERGKFRIDEQNTELQRGHRILAIERTRLQEALKESEALRREQADFTYSVSHDLKSPTNTVRMVLDEIELNQGDSLPEDIRAMLAHGQATVHRMGEQIEDILAYASSTGGKEESKTVDLGQCIARVLEDLKGDIEGAGAEIDVGPMTSVHGYEKQLKSLLQNLIGNGIKYQPPGQTPKIRVSAERTAETGEARLVVSDNGIGIAEEHHERVFGLFQRLHRRDQFAGSGLGLSTCLRIAKNHGGDITVKSAPGEGSEFTVTLRLTGTATDQIDKSAA